MVAKKLNYTEMFLNEFKNVERTLQQVYGPNITFRDIEQKMEENGDTETARKMQLCRNIRNYASHNADIDTFMPIPSETYLYMMHLNTKFSNQIASVKDKMSRTRALTIRDNITYGAQRLSKLPSVPVVNDEGIILGLFNLEVLRKCISDELSLKTKIGKDNIKLASLVPDMCIDQNTSMITAEELFSNNNFDMLIVTDNGKTKGKYRGTLLREQV